MLDDVAHPLQTITAALIQQPPFPSALVGGVSVELDGDAEKTDWSLMDFDNPEATTIFWW